MDRDPQWGSWEWRAAEVVRALLLSLVLVTMLRLTWGSPEWVEALLGR